MIEDFAIGDVLDPAFGGGRQRIGMPAPYAFAFRLKEVKDRKVTLEMRRCLRCAHNQTCW